MSELHDLADVVDDHTGLARVVLEYTTEMKRTVDRAKEPGFDTSGWDGIAALLDVDAFVRVGPFKDRMDWPAYVAFLTAWASGSYWECSFRRITEHGNLVILELEERMAPGDHEGAANSASVFEFDDDGRLRRLDVYLQLPAGGA